MSDYTDALRNSACTRRAPDQFHYMSWADVVIGSRMLGGWEWFSASDTERRMFMLLTAEDIDTYWE